MKILNKIPRTVFVAFSGGVDSVAVVDFLTNNSAHDVNLMFFHHGTDNSELAYEFVQEFSSKRNLNLKVGNLLSAKAKHCSLEEYWRLERYKFLESVSDPVITCHHLDDVLETWIFSSSHGTPKLIPYSRNNIIRPFLLTRKSELINWCVNKRLFWVDDLSNLDLKFPRNRIRKNIIPQVLLINPGIYKVLTKKLISSHSV